VRGQRAAKAITYTRWMRPALAVALASSAIAGCSLIYNPNNLPGVPGEAGEAGIDAPPDAPPDAEIILDADPTMLILDSVAPSSIDEGQGDGGSRAALVVIGGRQIIDNNTTVEITADTGTVLLTLGSPVIAKNGNWIAIAVTAHVDPALDRVSTRSLTVKVTQTLPPELGGGTKTGSLSGKLTLIGHDELVPAKLPMAGAKINSPALDALYSKVDLSGLATAVFGGADRAKLRSVSGIKTAALNATGATGTATAVAGEAGGCGGGAPASSAGSCPPSGGGAGVNNGLLNGGGGGGGGFASAGSTGDGQGAGGAGSGNGDEQITSYDILNGIRQNQAGGGGGGGPTLPLVGQLIPGGGGGAGGGSIELTAGGDLTVGTVTANGGPGQSPGLAAGGGGGAGGLVMLRTGGTLTAGMISVQGGAGGGGNLGNNGGKGADGRVRWDAPAGGAPPVVAGTRTVHRGPSFLLTTQVFRITDPTISVIGTPGDRFDVSVENEGTIYTGQSTSIADTGMGVFSPPLHQGLNHVCIVLDGGKPKTSEAEKCVDVAFLP
jgi:hypothetical protein